MPQKESKKRQRNKWTHCPYIHVPKCHGLGLYIHWTVNNRRISIGKRHGVKSPAWETWTKNIRRAILVTLIHIKALPHSLNPTKDFLDPITKEGKLPIWEILEDGEVVYEYFDSYNKEMKQLISRIKDLDILFPKKFKQNVKNKPAKDVARVLSENLQKLRNWAAEYDDNISDDEDDDDITNFQETIDFCTSYAPSTTLSRTNSSCDISSQSTLVINSDIACQESYREDLITELQRKLKNEQQKVYRLKKDLTVSDSLKMKYIKELDNERKKVTSLALKSSKKLPMIKEMVEELNGRDLKELGLGIAKKHKDVRSIIITTYGEAYVKELQKDKRNQWSKYNEINMKKSVFMLVSNATHAQITAFRNINSRTITTFESGLF